jgi:hypothetical protein
LLREGANHSIFVGPSGGTSTVPRHVDIHEDLAKKICRDLGISTPVAFSDRISSQLRFVSVVESEA